eukprot:271762-Chlamydomonas_euryale.AAC.1
MVQLGAFLAQRLWPGHGAWGVGHGTWGVGHGVWGVGRGYGAWVWGVRRGAPRSTHLHCRPRRRLKLRHHHHLHVCQPHGTLRVVADAAEHVMRLLQQLVRRSSHLSNA